MIGDRSWLLVILVVLAVARITRLVNADAILNGPRSAIQRTRFDHLAYFVTCPWCVSIWVAAGVSTAAWYWRGQPWFQIVLLALAASYVTGLLASNLDEQ